MSITANNPSGVYTGHHMQPQSVPPGSEYVNEAGLVDLRYQKYNFVSEMWEDDPSLRDPIEYARLVEYAFNHAYNMMGDFTHPTDNTLKTSEGIEAREKQIDVNSLASLWADKIAGLPAGKQASYASWKDAVWSKLTTFNQVKNLVKAQTYTTEAEIDAHNWGVVDWV